MLIGGEGYDTLEGGAGNDRLVAGFGDSAYGNDGDDVIEVSTEDYAPALIDGGDGNDTLKLRRHRNRRHRQQQHRHQRRKPAGVAKAPGASRTADDYDPHHRRPDGATLTSHAVALNDDDRLTIEAGGELHCRHRHHLVRAAATP